MSTPTSSIIKSKKPIKFGKMLIITKLGTSEEAVKTYTENIRRQKPDISQIELDKEVEALVRKDVYYNAVMDEVASAYEFELHPDEVDAKTEMLALTYPDGDREGMKSRVELSIYKQLIYEDLANDWEISVSDEEVKGTLENFYKATGQPIREYLMDKNKFEEVRNTLKEQLISERLMNAFSVEYRLEE